MSIFLLFVPEVRLIWDGCNHAKLKYEPVREKTNNLGFRPGLTQTGLYSHRTLLEAGNFVFK